MKAIQLFTLLLIFLLGCGQGNQSNFNNAHMNVSKKKEKDMLKREESVESPATTTKNDPENPKEGYKKTEENKFITTAQNKFSTFSIDVDKASYSNSRRFIESGGLPPTDAVRIEEFINYFDYNYPQPNDQQPFSIYTETGDCPWDPKHQLVHIGLKGKEIQNKTRKPSNLVFLIDVSGSMNHDNKLPLLKRSFEVLLDNLSEKDLVSIVVYAGAAGLVLPPTPASDKPTILSALYNLHAGGSTAGGQGIMLAYEVAAQNKIADGNNRVIIATDGDFNVGQSSEYELEQLITEKRKSGIYITVLGFGSGNYQDSRMEIIADKGNGNYYYIDQDNEAKKIFSTEITGTLYTIAKDVKIQVEFNPEVVKNYRLIGYENRLLNKEDFQNDQKDAGEIGAGHTVTALYEVELASQNPGVELMKLNLRYKKPNSENSILIEENIKYKPSVFNKTSENFRFSAAVAGFGMLLKNSQYKGNLDYGKVLSIAYSSKGKDPFGYRSEMISLVEKASNLGAFASR